MDVMRGFDPEVIERRIRAYEAFGIHRTGWPGDDRTSAWLRDELKAAGVTAEVERFSFPRVEYRNARISWPGGQADGVPMYDGGFTDYGGLTSDLCEDSDSDPFGKIMIATSALQGDKRWTAPDARALYDKLKDEGVLGVVVPSGDTEGRVVLRNAEHIGTPFGIPVLQIGERDARALVAAIVLSVEGTIEVDGERLKSVASNTVATVPGTDPEAKPLVVMTPKSGWFTCAAERGGGIAIWLGIADALAAVPQRRTVHFVASAGHELHHLGLQDYLGRRRALPQEAAAWLHLGASIGAKYPQPRMGASDETLHGIATASLEASGVGAFDPMPAGESGNGEARNLKAAGARFVTFLGGHRYFHSPQDTFDVACDAESVSRWGHAAWGVIEGMIALED
ncbi:MAG: M28 family peptidase [Chloroflexi bacterium]|nr:M28 family peptidase [Chloroflexota bacterium]